ncbi:MAG: hypothetical protein HY735_02535 [Verrucomicrobia bacterium]|nr:hypothetical protein [Verrucomicrobiota bacterium]
MLRELRDEKGLFRVCSTFIFRLFPVFIEAFVQMRPGSHPEPFGNPFERHLPALSACGHAQADGRRRWFRGLAVAAGKEKHSSWD